MDVRQHKAERAHGFCVGRPRVKHLVDGICELFHRIPFVEQLLNLLALALARPVGRVSNIVSGISILTSMAFVLFLSHFPLVSAVFLIITILLDWFDGLIAKKFGRATEEGYVVDVMSDRLSEGIIFSVFFFPWFFLFVLNCFLSMKSVVRKEHIIIPLRHIFLVFYALSLFLA